MKKLLFSIAFVAICSCIFISCDKKGQNEPTTDDPTPSYEDPNPTYNKNMAGKTMTLAISSPFTAIKINFTSNTSGTIITGNVEHPYESMVYTQTGESSATLIIKNMECSMGDSPYVFDFQLALFYIDDNHGTVNGTGVSTDLKYNRVKNYTYTYESFTVF